MKALTIVASVSTATGITVLKNLLTGTLSFEPVIGGFITGTLLLILAMFSVDIAAALALLLLLTSILINAGAILKAVQR